MFDIAHCWLQVRFYFLQRWIRPVFLVELTFFGWIFYLEKSRNGEPKICIWDHLYPFRFSYKFEKDDASYKICSNQTEESVVGVNKVSKLFWDEHNKEDWSSAQTTRPGRNIFCANKRSWPSKFVHILQGKISYHFRLVALTLERVSNTGFGEFRNSEQSRVIW